MRKVMPNTDGIAPDSGHQDVAETATRISLRAMPNSTWHQNATRHLQLAPNSQLICRMG